MGRIEWSEIPRVLNAADVLIQPGQDDDFNAFRLPSKLPEFMAMGKPVILPRTNLGRFLAEGDCAIVLQTSCVHELAACAQALFEGPELRAHLGAAAINFARKHFSWSNSGKWIELFHRRLCGIEKDNGERNPVALLAAHPIAELPEEQAACEQLMQLNCARWPAIVESLREAEERLARMSLDGAAAKIDFETRLFEVRKTRSWRLMRFLRRVAAMLWRGEEGGWLGFFKWFFRRPTASKKTFDPFNGTALHTTDFDRSKPQPPMTKK